jgi:ferredoxin-thioredoxin reductase catalytic subunit
MSTVEEVLKLSEKYAEQSGLKLNPDTKHVEKIIKGLVENEKKYGFRYCPCRVLTGNEEEDRKKICPCFWHKQEIKHMGRCLCGLFVSKEYYEKHKKIKN